MSNDLSRLSLQQLRSFVEVARTGNIRVAADRRSITQPALTIQLQKLEKALDVKLLIRGARGTTLTLAGEKFLEAAEAAVHLLERAVADAKEFSRTQTALRIGFAPTAGKAMLAGLLDAAFDRGITMTPADGFSEDLWAAAASGRLDAVCCFEAGSAAGLHIIRLYHQEFVVVGPPAVLCELPDPSPVSILTELPLVLSQRKRLTREWIEDLSRLAGVAFKKAITVPLSFRLDLMLRQSHCAVVPLELFEEELDAQKLVARHLSPPIQRDVVLAIRNDVPAVLANFLEASIKKLVSRRGQTKSTQ